MMNLIPALSDEERFPGLSDLGFLQQLRQDSCGPRFNFKSGDRLTADSLLKVREYGKSLRNSRFWHPGKLPEWLPAFLENCRATVPAYRLHPADFRQMPTLHRPALAAKPWQFVPDTCNADDLLVYSTSGTTGRPMEVLFDAISQAEWLPQLETVLAPEGITIEGGPNRVSICLVCFQQQTLTYASLSTYLRGAGVLKINLNPADWNDQADRIRFLEKYNPEILTGDPLTFHALAGLAPSIRPKAIVSSAMALTDGLRRRLSSQFGCPVYDIYSLTECRMIAVARETSVHRLIRPDLYVEILHSSHDTPVEPGERGEIALTGGNNPFLPLIRYRTGDHASLHHDDTGVTLRDFSGRAPVIFLTASGRFLNNVDISRAMSALPLAAFSLHQYRDRSIKFSAWGEVEIDALHCVLAGLFGESISCNLNIDTGEPPLTKPVQYSSDFFDLDIRL